MRASIIGLYLGKSICKADILGESLHEVALRNDICIYDGLWHQGNFHVVRMQQAMVAINLERADAARLKASLFMSLLRCIPKAKRAETERTQLREGRLVKP